MEYYEYGKEKDKCRYGLYLNSCRQCLFENLCLYESNQERVWKDTRGQEQTS